MTAKLNQLEMNGCRMPATFHDAIYKIKDGLHKGLVSFEAWGRYELKEPGQRTVYSPVGIMLTRAQRKAIVALDGDDEHPFVVWAPEVLEAFTQRNIEGMLGMTLDEACDLEHEFDVCADPATINGRKRFVSYLNGLLDGKNHINPALQNK